MKNKILYICIVSSILPLLDSSVINITLESISITFNRSVEIISWAITTYIIGTSIGIPLVPYLSKQYGSIKLWRFAILFFLIGSFICGLTSNFYLFIIGRIVQGLSAGLLIPLVQVILVSYFGKENTRSTMAFVGIPAIFAPAIAPLLGSIITEYFSWRVLFFINIPLIIHVLFLSKKMCFTSEKYIQQKIIFFDIILISIGYALSLYALFQININNYSIKNLSTFLLGMFLILFGFYISVKSKKPSLKISLFQKQGFSFSVVISFFIGMIFNGFLVLYPIISLSKHKSIILIGCMLAIQGVGSLISRMILKTSMSKSFKSFNLIGIGMLVCAIATVLLQYSTTISIECIVLLVRGLGIGIATMTVLSVPFEWINHSEIADGAAISRMFQQLGGAIGIVLSTFIIGNNAYVIFGLLTLLISIFCLFVNSKLCNHSNSSARKKNYR
jgi:EmrB/QacA subfamily drug resistance transporter